MPELRTAPIGTGFLLAAEFLTAGALLLSGLGLLAHQGWGTRVAAIALGMLLSTFAARYPFLASLDVLYRYWDGPHYAYLAKTLYAVDELSGFVAACALVRPTACLAKISEARRLRCR